MTRRKDLRTASQRRATATASSATHSPSYYPTTKSLGSSPTSVASDGFFPQPMEIAFSLEAGTFSSDLFECAATTAALPNAYVICFEDILVPMKWMVQNLGLRATTQGIQEAKQRMVSNPNLHESIVRIEQSALQLLTNVSSRGPVCVLSEQSARFVELICQTFFPRLAYCLASPQVLVNVQVMGAPRKFETVMEKTAWRVNLLQALVRERLFAGSPHLLMDRQAGRFGLIVVSPHQVDMMACGKAMEVAPFLVPKSVRVPNARHVQALDQFMLHLQTLHQWLSDATPCPTPFNVTM